MSAEAKLEVAIKALRFYAEQEVYSPPDDWDYPGMGGPPTFEDCQQVNDVAIDALHEIGA